MDEDRVSPAHAIGYLIVLLAIWSVVGRYRGITHDAVIYVLQVVALIRPDPLAGDVFLRFGSQDQFTVFPRLAAPLFRVIAPDFAAAALTLMFLTLWYAAAWSLSRRLQGTKLALLSMAPLLFIPGVYSAKLVFTYAEHFMTARCLAEAVSLIALLALLHRRRLLAVGLIAVALLIHPLMAFPVLLLMLLQTAGFSGPRGYGAAAVGIIAGAILGSLVLGGTEPVMRGQWLELARLRSNFLFTDLWLPGDWEVPAQIMLTLTLGAVALPRSQARSLLIDSTCIAACGLVLAVFASQVLELKILLQGQPWRWLWIGRLLATVLLPLIILTLWRQAAAGRAAALLLAAAWLLNGAGSYREVPPIGVSGLLCLLALLVWVGRSRLSQDATRLVSVLATVTVVLVGVVFVSILIVALKSGYSVGRDPFWVQRVKDVIFTPGVATLFAFVAWWTIIFKRSSIALGVFAVASVAMLAGSGPETLRRWTTGSYGESGRVQFSHWRELIPRESEVLWRGGSQSVWLLLDRRSYLSISQGAGAVFSEQTTSELARRANVLGPLVSPGMWFMKPTPGEEPRDLTPEIMASICTDPVLGFVVSEKPLVDSVASAEWPSPGYHVYLNDCARYRAQHRP